MSYLECTCKINKFKGNERRAGTCKAKRTCEECRHWLPKTPKQGGERLAVACTKCNMWFDTATGWKATAVVPGGLPVCPCCHGVLIQCGYEEFKKQLQATGEWADVKTWEWPTGEYWKARAKQ